MKKTITVIITSIIIIMVTACSNKKQGNLIVQGKIKGLKKGKLYLQKKKDTITVTVDSILINEEKNFVLSDNIKEPEIYFLTFDGNTTNKHIMFFAEPGEITINDKIEEYGFKPLITGSKNQEVYEKFKLTDQKFKEQRLSFIAKSLEAQAKKDTTEIKKTEKDYNRMIRRRFLYATNFAVTHADYEVAPYIALTELFEANIYLLDTINNSLSDKVKNSLYGKKLNKYIKKIKENEK